MNHIMHSFLLDKFDKSRLYAAETNTDKPLIIYYSRTGKSRIVVDAIKKYIHADVLEINDTKDRSGAFGYIRSAFDSYFDRYTVIEPAQPDLSAYSTVIIVSPIWNWKLSICVRTLIRQGALKGKRVTCITTANEDIKKYEHYGDDAPFIKKFFRDYIRDKKQVMQSFVAATDAQLVTHCHIPTKDKTAQEIETAVNGFADTLATKLAAGQLPYQPVTEAASIASAHR